jgi:hypothetical protein
MQEQSRDYSRRRQRNSPEIAHVLKQKIRCRIIFSTTVGIVN